MSGWIKSVAIATTVAGATFVAYTRSNNSNKPSSEDSSQNSSRVKTNIPIHAWRQIVGTIRPVVHADNAPQVAIATQYFSLPDLSKAAQLGLSLFDKAAEKSRESTAGKIGFEFFKIGIAAFSENFLRTPVTHVQNAVQANRRAINDAKLSGSAPVQLLRAPQAFSNIYRNSGLSGFWKGNTPATAIRMIQRYIVFEMTQMFSDNKVNPVLGALATTGVETVVLTPAEVALRLIQPGNATSKSTGFFSALKEEGMSKISKAGPASFLRNFVFNAIFATANQSFPEERKKDPFIFRLKVGIAAVLGSHYFDNLQAEISERLRLGVNTTDSSIKMTIDAGKSVMSRGISGIFTGGGLRNIGVGLGFAISNTLYRTMSERQAASY
ncbi:hypothetical protein EBR57_01700 [bacterium]|nr:hypothetical protein [bacterium]